MSSSTLAPNLPGSSDGTKPSCEKCGTPLSAQESLVCQHCGWYASIGSFVEIDQQWEADGTDQQLESSAETVDIPDWVWLMLGCVVVVVAESIAVRLLTSADSPLRARWSILQLLIGGLTLAVCHLTAFILLMRDDSEAGLLEVVLKPIRPWMARFRELPLKQWLCHAAASSLTAVLMSVLVIGAIPYERLLDWGFAKPVSADLQGAIAAQAQAGTDQSLTEAVEELGGTQNLSDQPSKAKKKKTATDEPVERKEEDCVIIGYRANDEGMVYLLILAGENFGHLQHVGQVSPNLPLKELRALSKQLAANTTFDPFIPLQMENVTWVEPKVTCRISFDHKGKKGGLYETKLESLLGELDLAETLQPAPASQSPPASQPKE